jgi:hypothetical protein
MEIYYYNSATFCPVIDPAVSDPSACNRRVDFCGPSVEEHQKLVLITNMPGILGVVQLED